MDGGRLRSLRFGEQLHGYLIRFDSAEVQASRNMLGIALAPPLKLFEGQFVPVTAQAGDSARHLAGQRRTIRTALPVAAGQRQVIALGVFTHRPARKSVV